MVRSEGVPDCWVAGSARPVRDLALIGLIVAGSTTVHAQHLEVPVHDPS